MRNLIGVKPRPALAVPAHQDGGDDAGLVALAKVDRRAFAPLYVRYADPVYRYCLRRLGTKDAAEDATAQVFVKVLAALPSYRDDGPSFRSWLFAVAHNVLVVDRAPGPEAAALAAETRRDVRALLAAVAPDQRRVLELRLAGLSTAEIAAALDRPAAAIRGIQFRAEARLRSLMGVVTPGKEAVDA